MNIIQRAFEMTAAVEEFAGHARIFYYDVVLAGRACPECGGDLCMTGEGRCRCLGCDAQIDPTIGFQRCSACGGQPKLSIRRYACANCGADVPSMFLFDGRVFDAEYFRQRMAESRERRHELREAVRQMLAESRSGAVTLPAAELSGDLLRALDGLSLTMIEPVVSVSADRFDLNRYQAHVRAYIREFAISLDEIPPLSENTRKDRVWRFIAIIFLAHAGILDVWQDGPDILVSTRETDAKGQGLHGSAEGADGIKRPAGRAEA